jgi:hypothetical protein
MILALALAIAAVVVLPHLVDLDRAPPATAAVMWLAALVIRAITGVLVAVFFIFVVPATEVFSALTHWCWHAVLPLIAAHLGLDGHSVGDAAVIVPAAVLAASLLSLGFGLVRATRSLRTLITRCDLGRGPGESVIVGGEDVIVAVAGIARPRILVSAGALTVMDDAELVASLDHERGHIVRRHRFVLLVGEVCRALGRFVPGSGRALAELAFHLERDADSWALARRNDPLALASAICKAALPPHGRVGALSLGGGPVTRRVGQLVDPGTPSMSVRTSRLLAVTMVGFTLAIGAALPAATSASVQRLGGGDGTIHCLN